MRLYLLAELQLRLILNHIITLFSHVNCLTGINAKAAQYTAKPRSRVQMNLIIIGDMGPFHGRLPPIHQNSILTANIFGRRMTEQHAFFATVNCFGILEASIVHQLLRNCVFQRQRCTAFIQRYPCMNADKIIIFYVIRQLVKAVHRFPIEQMPVVRKICLQMRQTASKSSGEDCISV